MDTAAPETTATTDLGTEEIGLIIRSDDDENNPAVLKARIRQLMELMKPLELCSYKQILKAKEIELDSYKQLLKAKEIELDGYKQMLCDYESKLRLNKQIREC